MASAYNKLIIALDSLVPDKFKPFWNHSAGPKTVFFWAPVVKWGLVIASVSDLSRPADKVSLGQSLSLGTTGLIWARYSLVIIPKNYGLFSVNLFVAVAQYYQCFRVYSFQKKQTLK